jgi:chemotaxis protein MotB
LVELAGQLKTRLPQISVFSETEVVSLPEGVEVSFQTDKIFKPGTAFIFKNADKELRDFGRLLQTAKGDFRIIVEGHTARASVRKKPMKYPTNWELSGARAFKLVRLLEETGVSSARLQGVGFGATRPKLARDLAEAPVNRWHRRIVIRLVPSSY